MPKKLSAVDADAIHRSIIIIALILLHPHRHSKDPLSIWTKLFKANQEDII